jgi:hypothetical protein
MDFPASLAHWMKEETAQWSGEYHIGRISDECGEVERSLKGTPDPIQDIPMIDDGVQPVARECPN